ncbi:hypothetical protein [Pseudomonas cremoricolorata]|uniref:Uncharacterized protein n=1 Tax=Pseudomonas cremoricolorata TaxID=157783 RepID=A0A089WM94_9PSED|nr:hypothetical protein [Pseudomonas cremoricolorata]AIR89691.1 hypothetical protein LK03_10490 [Pseudomonas cremoricolorata]
MAYTERPSPATGDDHDPARAVQRERMITELRQTIARVPEQTEFTNTKIFKVWGPVAVVALLGLVALSISLGKLGMIAASVFLLLGALWISWEHRNAGQPFMRLTRRQLFVDTLDQPVELADVEDIDVQKEAMAMLAQTLTLGETATLPTHRVLHMRPFASQAEVSKDPQPQVRIVSAGLASAGRTLGREEVVALLSAYRDAAQAQRTLDALLSHA